MKTEIFDVVLQSTGAFVDDFHDWEQFPLPTTDFWLSSDIWIGKLPYGISSDIVFTACAPSGFNFHPSRQYGSHYALVRRVRPLPCDYYTWDSEEIVDRILSVARLVHPTTMATMYAARLYFEEGKLDSIVAGPTQGFSAQVHIPATTKWRNWLCKAEMEDLRVHMQNYIVDAPDRVRQARRHMTAVFHTYYADQRCALLVTSLESLLQVGRERMTRQFISRVQKLAENVGIVITAKEANQIYSERSSFVHGDQSNYSDLSEAKLELIRRFERVLRRALLRASTDKNFSGIFNKNADIMAAFGAVESIKKCELHWEIDGRIIAAP